MSVISDKANILITNEDFHDLMHENVDLQQQLAETRAEIERLEKMMPDAMDLAYKNRKLKEALEVADIMADEIMIHTGDRTRISTQRMHYSMSVVYRYRALRGEVL